MTTTEILNTTRLKKSEGIGIDSLWFLVVFVGFLFFTSLVPLPPNDFWWHLKIGQLIYTNHAIPTTNMFAWTLPLDQPYVYAAWLAEYLFYLLYHLGQLELVIATRTVLIGIAVWLVAIEARRRSGSWRIAAMVITLLCVMITNNLPVRTQMFAWIPFVITYLVLKRYSEGKCSPYYLVLCPLLMLFWVNVHGSYILGLVLFAAFLAGAIISRFLKQSDALGWTQVAWIGTAGVFTALATLVNPRFTGIIGYTVKLLTDPSSQKLIEEWQSPTPKGFANIFFFISILLFIVVLAISKYQLSPTEIILTLGFLWLAWSGMRYVIWYGMITAPILACMIAALPMKTPSFPPQKNWLNVFLAVLLFLPLIVVSPWLVERMPLPETYWQQVLRDSPAGPLISTSTPVAVSDYLNAHPGGSIFNEMGYGSYLIWVFLDEKEFIDSRVELFPYDQWMDYIQINNGAEYDAVLSKYGADRLVLDKKLQPDLIKMLLTDENWTLEYEDPYSQVWVNLSK